MQTLYLLLLKRTGACSVFDVHCLILRKSDGFQAISTPSPTSEAFQNFYLEVHYYPSIFGFDGEWMNIPLQPAPGDWSKCPILLGVLDYNSAIPVGQVRPLHILVEERLVDVKYGGLICWHQPDQHKIPTEWTSHIWIKTTIKKASVSSSGLFSWNATIEITNLWPSDPLLSWEHHFKWWLVWLYGFFLPKVSQIDHF